MKEREVGKEFAVSWSIIVHAFLCAFLSLSIYLSLSLSLSVFALHAHASTSLSPKTQNHFTAVLPLRSPESQPNPLIQPPLRSLLHYRNKKKKKKNSQLQPKAKLRSTLLRQQPQNLNETSSGDCWLRSE